MEPSDRPLPLFSGLSDPLEGTASFRLRSGDKMKLGNPDKTDLVGGSFDVKTIYACSDASFYMR